MKNETSGWVFFANNDMLAAELMIDHPELSGEIAFLCQQAIEKYFKGYLTEHGKKFKKIHDLLVLYSEVKSIQDWNLDVIILSNLNDIYTVARYPGNVGMTPEGRLPSIEKARSYWELAKRVKAIFTELVGK